MRPPERSSNPHPLHNFTLPTLKWGNQRFLRCVKLHSPPPSDHSHHQTFKSNPINHNSTPNTIARKKLTFDHRIVKKLKASILEDEERAGNDNSSSKPWNLRTRRAACKAPLLRQQIEVKMKDERVKLSVSLLKEEVEMDFMAMVGTRPPRRPKKRPRIVQKQLDSLFPAIWLTQVSEDLYKVSQVPE
ncbi:hypothetical protein Dsin_005165 [Dipteronia sinensis]|uniref:DUF1639 family protein n=1 Tax=Dipteronia sinensis TaxID=43782 RepID=A0AAE0AWS0_9ROSI|nr:hypothetical protein Dsin_005165 [Dipteronia sinensis]